MWLNVPVLALVSSIPTVLAFSDSTRILGHKAGWNQTTNLASRNGGRTISNPSQTTNSFSEIATALPEFPTANSDFEESACTGCTVNVLNAAVNWWLPPTYRHPVSSFWIWTDGPTSAGETSLTLVSATEILNLTQMIQTSRAYSIDDKGNYVQYTARPSAATTSAVLRTAYISPDEKLIKATDLRSYRTDPSPASVTVEAIPSTAFVASSTTPFVLFTAYELTSRSMQAVGSERRCSAVTSTVSLPATFAFFHSIQGIESLSQASGAIPTNFAQSISQSSCTVGAWRGDVTVLVVVDLYYGGGLPPGADVVHIKSSVMNIWETTNLDVSPSVYQPLGTLNRAGTSIMHHSHSSVEREPGIYPYGTQLVIPVWKVHIESSISAGNAASFCVIPSNIMADSTARPDGDPHIDVTPTAQNAGSNRILPSDPTPRPVPILTVGTQTVTGNAATQFYLGPGATLTPGGSVVVKGTTIGLDHSAEFLVVGGSSSFITAAPSPTEAPVLPINGAYFTPELGSGTTYAIGGFYLTPGGVITVAELTISLSPSATELVLNGVTTTIAGSIARTTNAPILTIGDTTVTPQIREGRTEYVYRGQTLVPGQAISADGSTISLATDAAALVLNGIASALFPATSAQSSSVQADMDTNKPEATEKAAWPSQKGASSSRRAHLASMFLLSIAGSLLSYQLFLTP